MKRSLIIIVICIFCFNQVSIFAKDVSPLSFGLKESNSPLENFYVLYNAHVEATKTNSKVSYNGITSISVEIPADKTKIPLTAETDFAGVTINVVNNVGTSWLFEAIASDKRIMIPASVVDKGDFSAIPHLSNGLYQLSLIDTRRWTERLGYNDNFIRKDILFIRNGRAENRPVADYNTSETKLECYYCEVSEQPIIVKNLTIVRDAKSTKITQAFRFVHQNNVQVENVTVKTPTSTMVSDQVITIFDCTNVSLKNVRIEGTYSSKSKAGYGIFMNNVWNSKFENLYGHGEWGVFGTFNLQDVFLKDCDINRFDIHCYGKNVKSEGCKFSSLYNQYASVYGVVVFKNCTFDDFIPVLIEDSYNAYTPFDVEFEGCTFNIKKGDSYFITLRGLKPIKNKRQELQQRALPNVRIKDCKINLPEGESDFEIIHTGAVLDNSTLDYASYITMDNVVFNREPDLDVFSSAIETKNKLNINLSKVYVQDSEKGKKNKIRINGTIVGKNANVKCNGKKVKRKVGLSSLTAMDMVIYGSVSTLLLGGVAYTYKKTRRA